MLNYELVLMNKSLIYYWLQNWLTKPDVTNQCKRIRDLLEKEYESDLDFLNEIITVIYDDKNLENDTLEVLKRIVHGSFGQGGFTLDITSSEEASFWKKLLSISPNNGYLLAIYSDTLVLKGEEEKALPLFIKCFKLETESLYFLDPYIYELLLKSQYRLEYQLLKLESDIKQDEYEDDPEILEEIVSELKEEYATQPEVIENINKIVSHRLR